MNESARRARPATYQDVLDAPPNMVAEIAGGALRLHPRPAIPHAIAASTLGGLLFPFHYRRGEGWPGGWLILDEPELHLGEDVLVPDLGGWRRERMPPQHAPWIASAPDWVCEILSPGTRRFDTTEKRDLYGANGVGHLWHLDPEARTLEVFENRDGAWMLVAAVKDADEVRCAPFEAVGFPLSALWAE